MGQNIHNQGVSTQLNISDNKGDIVFTKKTRFAARFEKLNNEVANNVKYEGVLDALEYYLTKLDGIDMPTKLKDGGFSDYEILNATRKKEKYAKKLEKNKFFESAQWIDSQLFAVIKMNFESYIDPMIIDGESKDKVVMNVLEKIVYPVRDFINIEGEKDEFLNYDVEDIMGMIYFLTGKCQLNWKNYDSL